MAKEGAAAVRPVEGPVIRERDFGAEMRPSAVHALCAPLRALESPPDRLIVVGALGAVAGVVIIVLGWVG
jgi:hypothetical protein